MSKIFFTSDLHFGHANIIKYDNRPFNSASHMDEEIIRRWNKTVSQEDTVFILGDISWYDDKKTIQIVNRLNGHKHLILGNHDKKIGGAKKCFESIKDYAELRYEGHTFIMSHYPIHFYNHQYKGAIMLYGHVHNNKDENKVQLLKGTLNKQDIPCKMVNVGIMMWDYRPVCIDKIIEREQ